MASSAAQTRIEVVRGYIVGRMSDNDASTIAGKKVDRVLRDIAGLVDLRFETDDRGPKRG